MTRLQRVVLVMTAAGTTWGIAGVSERAGAFPPYEDDWLARYPGSTLPQRMDDLTGSRCNICHTPPSRQTEGNCYRLDLRDLLYNTPMNFEQAMAYIEWRDSDADGVPNIVEILLARIDQPGQVGYNPGLVGTTGRSPCSPTPTEPVTNQSETPSWCYANCDGSTGSPRLTGNDFLCFINAYANGQGYANCDGSTGTPALTGNDFQCFINAFAAGCL